MRTRLAGARTPSGRLSRANAIKPVEPTVAFRARQAAHLALIDPEWGSVLGQMFLAGRVSASQYEAGKAYARLVQRYRHLIDAPHPKAGWLLATVTPGASSAIPETTVYESAAILAEISLLHAAMPGVEALDRLVVDDLHDSPSIPEAITALTYLVSRWGVKVTD
jgi:hypothetical protein